MLCPKCKANNIETAFYCQKCGKLLIKLPKKGVFSFVKGCFVSILITTGMLFLIIFLFGFLSAFSGGTKTTGSSKTKIISGSGKDIIAVIDLNGIIVDKEPGRGFGMVSEEYTGERRIKELLSDIEKDTSIKAVLFRINSPGGSAAASEEILRDIYDFKRKTQLKVASYFSDISASGGYYVSMASDKIIANPSNITGSIGVIISYVNFAELASKYGVSEIVYKSGKHKDILNSFRKPTDEENTIMQNLVNDAYDNFVLAVEKGRKLSHERVLTLADGRVYSAKMAKEEGLIDSMGTFEDSISELKSISGLKNATVVEYGIPGFLESFLGTMAGKINLSILPKLSIDRFTPGTLLYLYTN